VQFYLLYHSVHTEAGIHPTAHPVIIWSHFPWRNLVLAFNSPVLLCLVPNARKRGLISPFTHMNSLRSTLVCRVKKFLEEVDCLTEKIKAVRPSETSVKTYLNIRHKRIDNILILKKTALRISFPRCVLYQLRTYEFRSGRTHSKNTWYSDMWVARSHY